MRKKYYFKNCFFKSLAICSADRTVNSNNNNEEGVVSREEKKVNNNNSNSNNNDNNNTRSAKKKKYKSMCVNSTFVLLFLNRMHFFLSASQSSNQLRYCNNTTVAQWRKRLVKVVIRILKLFLIMLAAYFSFTFLFYVSLNSNKLFIIYFKKFPYLPMIETKRIVDRYFKNTINYIVLINIAIIVDFD